MENDHLNDALNFLLAAQEALKSRNQWSLPRYIQSAIDEINLEVAKRDDPEEE